MVEDFLECIEVAVQSRERILQAFAYGWIDVTGFQKSFIADALLLKSAYGKPHGAFEGVGLSFG